MAKQFRFLFVGDVVGRPGRKAVKEWLPNLRKELSLDFIVINGENVAGGLGITEKTAQEIFDSGADCITTGNHVWRQKEAFQLLTKENKILRPANFPPEVPGCGWVTLPAKDVSIRVAVVNIMGQIFMDPILDCPFRTLDKVLTELQPQTSIIVVDFHAEATSEKQTFAYYADRRVTAVIGTHTHVPTADERILQGGTAYITDVGMTGSIDSVIGMKVNEVMYRFLTKLPVRFEVASGITKLCAVLVEADINTGKALSIQRIERISEYH